jgi:hypothetical protein
MQRFFRFARYWDLIANSGRFKQTLPFLLGMRLPPPVDSAASTQVNMGHSPFYAFLEFSDWLWKCAGKTNDLTPELLVDALYDFLCNICRLPAQKVQQALLNDYVNSGARGSPSALRGLLPKRDPSLRHLPPLAQRQQHHHHHRKQQLLNGVY